MLTVDKMKHRDLVFAVDLANTMNWNMAESDFAFNMQMEPNGCFVLKDNTKPIGLATCLSYGKIGWFGNLIVDKAHRKQGSGTMLVNHAVKYLNSVGVTTVGLYAYTHLINFYSNIGFKPNSEFLVMKAEKVGSPNNPRSSIPEISKPQDISMITELDASCFGGSRAKMLSNLISNANNVCYVAKENGKFSGFALAKVYEGMAEIGPLVCQRNSANHADGLISAVSETIQGFEAYACLPSSEASFIEEMGKFGFKEEFRVVRMFLGSPVQKDCIYFAESLERG